VDAAKKVVLYVVKKLGEVDMKRLMHLMYLIDRELFYLCGFTLFSWRVTLFRVRSFDVYDAADYLVDAGYLDKEVKDSAIVYKIRREVEVKLPKQLRDVVDKVLEKAEGVDNLEEHIVKLIDPNIAEK
jgi:hypothetical protein